MNNRYDETLKQIDAHNRAYLACLILKEETERQIRIADERAKEYFGNKANKGGK